MSVTLLCLVFVSYNATYVKVDSEHYAIAQTRERLYLSIR